MSDAQSGLPALIVFFDGECPLCNSAVRFVMRHDKAAMFHYAALSSEAADRLLKPQFAGGILPDTLILYSSGKLCLRSDAVLGIIGQLPRSWHFLLLLRILPSWLRDMAYRAVASSRNILRRGSPSCYLLPPEYGQRILH